MFYNVCDNCAKTSCSGCTYEVFRSTCYFPTWYFYPGYDSDRYELVEKKDWKIKQLKEEIAHYEMRLKEEDALRVQSYERESKLRLEHVKALDELKELETNNE